MSSSIYEVIGEVLLSLRSFSLPACFVLVVHRKTDLNLEMCLQVVCWCCSLFGLLQENTINWVVSKQQEFIHHCQEDWEVQDGSTIEAVSGGGHFLS